MIAATVVRALAHALHQEEMFDGHLSLARTAELLITCPQEESSEFESDPRQSDLSPHIEKTPWGNAKRLVAPLMIDGTPMRWDLPACALGSSEAVWA